MHLATLIRTMIAVASLLCVPLTEAAIVPLKDFKDLLDTASQLESAALLSDPNSPNNSNQKRRELIYLFAREPKSTHCEAHNQKILKLFTEFKMKAHEFVQELRNGRTWFQFGFFGPLGAMKNMGKSEPFLNSVALRYEELNKNGHALIHDDVECDLFKFQIINMKDMVFVLATDIRQLILEETQIQVRAIYEKLKAEKFFSPNNFYDTHELVQAQQKLMLDFFARRVDQNTTLVGHAMDHFIGLDSLIIGRILDSCYSALEYKKSWQSLEEGRLGVCPRSHSDPNNRLFLNKFNLDDFEEIFKFCQSFLDAL